MRLKSFIDYERLRVLFWQNTRKLNKIDIILPKPTLLWSIHGSIRWTVEFLLEVFWVAQRSDYSESSRRMRIWENLSKKRFRSLYFTPDLGVWDEQQLLWSVLSQSWQSWFCPITFYRPQVGSVCLTNASIISNVFTLGIFAIQLKTSINKKGPFISIYLHERPPPQECQ